MYRVVKAFEGPKKPSAHTQKVRVKMFRPSKKYPSSDTIPRTFLNPYQSKRYLICLLAPHMTIH
jgi:hypothetical protein